MTAILETPGIFIKSTPEKWRRHGKIPHHQLGESSTWGRNGLLGHLQDSKSIISLSWRIPIEAKMPRADFPVSQMPRVPVRCETVINYCGVYKCVTVLQPLHISLLEEPHRNSGVRRLSLTDLASLHSGKGNLIYFMGFTDGNHPQIWRHLRNGGPLSKSVPHADRRIRYSHSIQ